MFKSKQDLTIYEEMYNREHEDVVNLSEIICKLLEIKPQQKAIFGSDRKFILKNIFPINSINYDKDLKLVMNLDQYQQLKPSVRKRLRKLDLVTVPLGKDSDYLKLKEDLKAED